ncbi:hypothetical protein NHX12_019948 [Muraenolepis orangiensis]|uniref:Uncharacterized protein n=1 Tax=Muraenolepis orangiensis TaxID=630683 RepID=A0A9Q0EUD8_9TELE|nr:hypothetical protein NHX12_019948 [Muraenolepis orangiensis]
MGAASGALQAARAGRREHDGLGRTRWTGGRDREEVPTLTATRALLSAAQPWAPDRTWRSGEVSGEISFPSASPPPPPAP